jgi:hypothetical protein
MRRPGNTAAKASTSYDVFSSVDKTTEVPVLPCRALPGFTSLHLASQNTTSCDLRSVESCR